MERDNIVRLLVIEESLNDAEMLTSILRNAGHGVRPVRAEDEEDVQAALNEHPLDLILYSTQIDHFSLEKALETVARTGKDIPLIAVSPEFEEVSVAEALKAGAADLVSKQHPEHLQQVVQRELHNLHQRRALRLSEAAQRESEKRCKALLDSSRDAITYVHDGMHIYANSAYLELFGFGQWEEIEGTPIMDMVAPEDHGKFKEFLRNYSKGEVTSTELEIRVLRADGNPFNAMMEFAPASVEGEACTQIIIRDQSLSKELEKKLKTMSKQDLLTGLYNRQYFFEELEQAVARVVAGASGCAVLYIDLDNFKSIEESVGIAGSDLVLSDIAGLIRQATCETDIAARFGDYAYTVLVQNPGGQNPEVLADTLRRAVEDHISEVGSQSVTTTCSIGICPVGNNAASAQDIIRRAELACQIARNAGGNGVHVHNPLADEHSHKDKGQHWAQLIQHALEHNQFYLVYQPIASLHGDAGEKYEVLLRMKDAQGAEVLPGQFLPIAEQSDLIKAIDRWVIEYAFKRLGERRREGNNTCFFIKLSAKSLGDETLLPWINEHLKQARLQGDSVVFEIAESAAVTQLKEAKNFTKGLKELHCGFTLDHFGSGINSFHLLKHLPADYLKIDGTFMRKLAGNPENQAMIKSITEMAHSMGKLTIAEFVEDAGCLAVLWQCGVNYIQGNFLQEPNETLAYDFSGETV